MNILHKKLIVKFDETHNKVFNVGGVELIRPDMWLHKDGDGETTSTYQENTNGLETTPQKATITHANSRYPYKQGDVVFLHYMAHVTSGYHNKQTKEAYIDADYVFFTYLPDGSYKMADGVHFGEQVYTDDEKTPSGIIIVVQKPKLCQIKLTHVPDGSPHSVGDIVFSIDNYNYPVNVDGKNLIMLREHEIIGELCA